jgi:hypothetical protein
MKRPLSSSKSKKNEEVKRKDPSRSWWAKPDDELVKERVDKFKDWYSSSKIDLDEGDRDQLIKEAVKRDPRIRNLLDMVVVKEKDLERKGNFLLLPIYSSQRGENIAKRLRLKTARRIRLDDYGWGVWELIDGQRDVRSLGALLFNRFGENVDPLYPRLAKFLAYLQNLGLIEITEKGK